MIYNLIYALCLALILCGLYFIFYMIINKKLLNKNQNDFITVVIGTENEQLPQTVYNAFVQANLLNFGQKAHVVVLDYGLSEDMKTKCFNIIRQCDSVHFCHQDDFSGFLENNFKF